MTMSPWTRCARQALRAGALGLVVLAVCAQGSARAQEDNEDSIWNVDKKIYRNFMKALGLKSPNDVEIDYRERSPLVLPPNRDLPPPQAAGVRPDPAWPVDPDQKRRKEAAERRKKPNQAYDPEYEARNLTPSELNAPGASSRLGGSGRTTNGSENVDGRNMQPSQLGYFGGLFSWSGFGFGGQKDEVATFTKEPPRTSLTAPPPGYQVPSAAEPYGVTKRTERSKAVPLDPAVGSLGN